MTTEHLIVDANRLPPTVRVGDHVALRLEAHVRRIEAEEVDVSGYSGTQGIAVLAGQVVVELTIEEIGLA